MSEFPIQRVVYRSKNGSYVRSGGTYTDDIGQADVFFVNSKKWRLHWKRYGFVQVPVSVILVSEEEKDPPYLAQLLKDHPGLTREKALAMIEEAGG